MKTYIIPDRFYKLTIAELEARRERISGWIAQLDRRFDDAVEVWFADMDYTYGQVFRAYSNKIETITTRSNQLQERRAELTFVIVAKKKAEKVS